MENKADLVLPSGPAVTLIHADINGVNSRRPRDLPGGVLVGGRTPWRTLPELRWGPGRGSAGGTVTVVLCGWSSEGAVS